MIKQRILIGFAAVLLVALALMHWSAFDGVERAWLDAEFRYLRAHYSQAIEKDVVLIGVDEAALATQREPFALWHPYLGRLLKGLALAKPAVVGLEVVLPSRSFDFLIPQYDRPLLEGLAALRNVAPVMLAQSLDDRGNQRVIFPAYRAIAGLDGVGSVIVCRDPDHIVRRYDERACGFGEIETSFAGRMAQHLGVQKKTWQGFINYNIGDAITYIPVQKVLEWIEHNNEASLNDAFRGKPVMLGMIQPFADRFPLPVALAAFEPDTRQLPGVLIQVQALRSMLGPGLIAPLPVELALALAALAALFWFGEGGWRKLLLFALTAAALVVFSTVLLWKNVQFPAASLVGISFLALAARFAYETFLKSSEQHLLREAFAGYVNPQILKKILRGRIRPELGGNRQRVCIMCCNIRGFTSRAERMSPEAVIKLLNDYFSAAVSAVLKHEGTTSKISADGLLAFFGAPQPLANPEKNALEASQDVLENLARLNEQLAARGGEPLTVGIGLHSGEVVLGQVGAVLHREYTAVGDVVNVASRLEQATTELGYPVVCSAFVANAVGRAGGVEDLGERTLHGHPALHVFGWRPRLLSARAP